MPLFCFEDHLTVSSLCSLPSGVIVSQRAIDDPSKLGGAATFSPGPYQVFGRENAPEPYQMEEPGQYRGVETAAVVHPPAVDDTSSSQGSWSVLTGLVVASDSVPAPLLSDGFSLKITVLSVKV